MNETGTKTDWPEQGIIILEHPQSATCSASGSRMELPYQNSGGRRSLLELTESAAARLTQSATIPCRGCGADFFPVEARAAEAAEVSDAVACWLNRRKIPNR